MDVIAHTFHTSVVYNQHFSLQHLKKGKGGLMRL